MVTRAVTVIAGAAPAVTRAVTAGAYKSTTGYIVDVSKGIAPGDGPDTPVGAPGEPGAAIDMLVLLFLTNSVLILS